MAIGKARGNLCARQLVSLVALACAGAAGALTLEEGFQSPLDSAKPHTWYHMMNGNVTKEGITFEALAKLDEAFAERDAATARADAAVEKLRQDKLQTARNLKAMNLASEQIAAATGLSVAEIDTLK